MARSLFVGIFFQIQAKGLGTYFRNLGYRYMVGNYEQN